MDEKTGLPPYSPSDAPLLPAAHDPPHHPRRLRRLRHITRRSRAIKFFALACVGFIALAQWRQLAFTTTTAPSLSLQKLNDDLKTCAKLRSKPSDPVGEGRERNARFIEGGKPTLVKNATIWIGEPVKGTSAEDARAGKGWEWIRGDVLLQYGLIAKVQSEISLSSLPDDVIVYEARGRQLTSGIVDMHSHVGVDSLPNLRGNDDTNELSDNITPWARSIDGIQPFDPQFQVIKSGGVTTSLILPGSGNNIGGEAFLMKHAVGKSDGREEISAVDLLADPDRNWRYIKMACGENAKRVYGRVGQSGPFSRLGESYAFRHAFEQAAELVQKQDDWCAKADALGVENMDGYLPQELAWDTLGAVLRGQVHVNTHCYTVPDLEAMVDHSNEFKFPIRTFHHAHQTFLVPEILKRTWGGRAPASAIFADNMYYKAESYVGSEFAGKYLYDEGLTPVYVSDNPVLNAQHVLFEAAKGYKYGLPYHAALASVTTAPAEELGMGQRIGKVKPGFDADIVVWDSDPLSVGAAPVQVWIDGAAQFKDPVELDKPVSEPMIPDETLSEIIEEPTELTDVVFRGVTAALFSDETKSASKDKPLNIVVSKGKISCMGICEAELATASSAGIQTVDLKNGYLTHSFTGVAGTLGLNEIDAESSTDNGANPLSFSRAVDGLMLGSKKLQAGANYGVTRAISAPAFGGTGSHHGVSVGFVTTAETALDEGAVFAEDVALHYTLDSNVRSAGASYSASFGDLRTKLISALTITDPVVNPFSEYAYLKSVIAGDMVLALTIQSADGIATALRIKSEIEKLLESSEYNVHKTGDGEPKLKMAIIGASESWMVAQQLAAADVGVILSPYQSPGDSWDMRRSLPGAPLSNGTTIDHLVKAGVLVGVGLQEDWQVRDLGLTAGTAFRNGEGRLSEKEALDIVSGNIYKILGVKTKKESDEGHFVVHEGNPLEIGSRVKAVGSGRDKILAFV